MDDFLPFDPPSGRPRSCTPLDSPPPVKRIREGLYPVSRRTAVPSAGRSRRSGVSGVPSRQANFPPVGTSTAQLLACRALPPVPAPTPEPEPTGDLVFHAPQGGQDPQPSTSQWVDLRTVAVPVASDTTTVSLTHGDPMEMLNRVHTRSPWGRETVVVSLATGTGTVLKSTHCQVLG